MTPDNRPRTRGGATVKQARFIARLLSEKGVNLTDTLLHIKASDPAVGIDDLGPRDAKAAIGYLLTLPTLTKTGNHTMTPTPTLSNAARTALKSFIANHADVRTGAVALPGGKTTGALTKAEILVTVATLAGDVAAIIAGADTAPVPGAARTRTAPAPETDNEDTTQDNMAEDARINAVLEAAGVVTDDAEDVPCELSQSEIEDKAMAILAMPLSERAREVAAMVRKAHEVRPVVQVASGGTQGASVGISTAPPQTFSAARVFGIDAAWAKRMKVTVYADPATPPIDGNYAFQSPALQVALATIKNGGNTWAYGPPGSGKTMFFEQVAARTGRALVRINMDRDLSRLDLFGGRVIRVGDDGVQRMEWQDGALTAAIKRPGCIVLLDEVSTGEPKNIVALHAVLEAHGAVLVPETGERIVPAPGVVFAVADNTNGTGDATGAYIGTGQQNAAFGDRFASYVSFDYMGADDEARVLSAKTGAPLPAAKHLVAFAGTAREVYRQGKLTLPPSLRRLMSWASLMVAGVDVETAYDVSIAGPLTSEDAAQVREIFNTMINARQLRAMLDGKDPTQARRASAPVVDATGTPDPF